MMMEGVKGGEDDMGESSMQCSDHPFRNSNPGGICAFCLQEKLGKLVSSSFPVAIFPSSSSSSPSFRSEVGVFGSAATAGGASSASSLSLALSAHPTSSSSSSHHNNNRNDCHYHHYYSRRARIPFLLTQKKKKKKEVVVSSALDHNNNIILKRSKSTATPRRRHFLDSDDGDEYSPQKRGFWSFLYHTKPTTTRRIDRNNREMPKTTTTTTNGETATPASTTSASFSQKAKGKDLGSSFAKKGDFVEEEESPNVNASAASSSLDRKVSRSRSVGCGSRSFSGDFFERISTGLGDCTLRRVESQREGKPKVATTARGSAGDHNNHHCIKERVKCGGIFGGFIMTSSSSSSSSSSYWVSSSSADDMNGKSSALAHGRSKSWGWAFASPIRAFSKPSSTKDGKSSNKNTTPNLAAIPSLLAVRG